MEKCIFVGYPEGYKSWRFYNPQTRKFLICEQAEFNERCYPALGLKLGPQLASPNLPSSSVEGVLADSSQGPEFNTVPAADNHLFHQNRLPDDDLTNQAPKLSPPSVPDPLTSSPPTSPSPERPPIPRNTQRHFKPPLAPLSARPGYVTRRSDSFARPAPSHQPILATSNSADTSPELSSSESEPESDELNLGPGEFAQVASPSEPDPRTFRQAIERWDGQQWLEASKEEIENQMRNLTWDLVKAPQGTIVIGSGWVFRIKRKADGSVERYKARLVAKGYSQRPGFDFFETFAPTFRSASLRLILALCAKHKLNMRSVDISHAFLNGHLEETVYMHQPEGFE